MPSWTSSLESFALNSSADSSSLEFSLVPRVWTSCVAFCVVLALAGAPISVWASSGGGGHGGGGGGGGHGGGEKKAESEEGDNKKGEVGVTGGRFAGDPVYVHLQPIILPIITDRGAEQIVTMIIDLQTATFELATEMHTNMPRLKDAILQALYGGLGDGSMRNANMLDLEKVKFHIKKTLNQVFGEGAVLEVLMQAIAQRRF